MEWLLFSTQAIVLLLSLIFLFALQGRLDVRALNAIAALLIWLLVRDFLATIAASSAINFIGDLGAYGFLLAWLRYYTGRKHRDTLFAIGLVIAAGLGIWIEQLGEANWFLASIILNAALLGYLFVAFAEISVHNTRDAEIIVDTRPVLITALVLIAAGGAISEYAVSPLGTSTRVLFYLSLWFVLLTQFQLYYLMSELTIAGLRRQGENLFEFMEALGSGIADRVDIQRILDMVVRSAAKTIEADGAVILMVNDVRNTLNVRSLSGFYPPPYAVPEIVKHRSASINEYLFSQEIPVGETLLGKAVSEGEPIFIPDSTDDERLSANTRKDFLFIQSFIAVPLIVKERVLGVISLVRRNPEHPFNEEDFQHVQTFATHASMTIDNFYTYLEVIENREIQREVTIAADIQRKLVPSQFPKSGNTDISVYSRSARGVSGDYYDVLEEDEQNLGIVMCDVAGKGVPAALVMVMIHSILHLISSSKRDVNAILTWINRGLCGQIDLDHYATMSYLRLNTADRSVTYSNAAHHPLMIIRPGENVIEQLDTEGLPVGIERDTVYPQKRIRLQPGDVLCLYTDGIIEAMNRDGEQFTLERLARLIRTNVSQSAEEITAAVQNALDEFVGDARQHDDQTLLVLKIT